MARNKSMGVRLGTPKTQSKRPLSVSATEIAYATKSPEDNELLLGATPNRTMTHCKDCFFAEQRKHKDVYHIITKRESPYVYQCHLRPTLQCLIFEAKYWCGFGIPRNSEQEKGEACKS